MGTPARFPLPPPAEGVPEREVEKVALAGRGFVDDAGLRDAILYLNESKALSSAPTGV